MEAELLTSHFCARPAERRGVRVAVARPNLRTAATLRAGALPASFAVAFATAFAIAPATTTGCGGGGAATPPPPADLGAPPDLAVPADMASPSDMTTPPPTDLGADVDLGEPPADMGVGADLGAPPDAGPPPGGSPSARGPYAATTTMATVTRGTRRIPVVAHVPAEAAGDALPVVLFMAGFQLQTMQYAGTIEHLASHGFVVVRLDPPNSLFAPASHATLRDDARAVLDWALGEAPFRARIDPARVGATGHSLGGKVTTMLAAADTRVRALYGLDPVNAGAGPLGYSADSPDITPAPVNTISIPVGIVGETLDATPRMGGFPFGGMACAPAGQNFADIYGALTAAPWAASWEIPGASHMVFLDDPNCGTTCSVCNTSTVDTRATLADVRTSLTAFFRRFLRDDAAMDEWLTGARRPSSWIQMTRP
jgi:hypothetical protein